LASHTAQWSSVPSQTYGINPDELKYEETEIGMRFVLTRKLPDGKWWELIWEMIMPLNVNLVYTEEPKRGDAICLRTIGCTTLTLM